MKYFKLKAMTSALIPLLYSLAAISAEVTPATSEDISAFDRNIQETHHHSGVEAPRNTAARVSKEINDFKKEKQSETEKSAGGKDVLGHKHRGHEIGEDEHGRRGRASESVESSTGSTKKKERD